MDSLTRFACSALALALITTSSASNATCWEYDAGPKAVYRNPSVRAEFKDTPLVITGRVVDARNISTPDDPEGYEWTVYTVKVLETFKGEPQRTVRLVSENTTARFYMDTGESYLLFVSQFPIAEMAGQERLPTRFVDNCGNSALLKDAEPATRTVRALSKAR